MIQSLADPDQKKVVFIMGPTASGKTDAAVYMAKTYGFQLINADAAQVYKQMDIGTAKPDKDQLLKTPHRLIDFVDPANLYSAASFRSDALTEIKQIHSNANTPVLVGGSMFYFRVLEKGLCELPEADTEIRKAIEQQANEVGWNHLHKALSKIDPLGASKISKNDSHRIQRSLEIYHLTGKTPSELFMAGSDNPIPYHTIKIIIAPYTRKELHQRIAHRFNKMLDSGLIEEVEKLRQRGDLTLELASMRTVGYRQVWLYLEGEYNKQEMVQRAIAATRQLAKRQLTWLRNERGVVWFTDNSVKNMASLNEYFGC